MEKRRILMVTPEYPGVAMVGGLASALGGLSHALKARGHEVRILIPMYKKTRDSEKFLEGDSNPDYSSLDIESSRVNGVIVSRIKGFNLGAPYTYHDGAGTRLKIEDAAYRMASEEAFIGASLFSASIPVMINKIADQTEWRPDVVHLHDWTSALGAYHIREDGRFSDIATVLTVHNPKYVGESPSTTDWQKHYILPQNSPIRRRELSVMQLGGEFFRSLLEAGIHFADAVNTVSINHASELQNGLEGIDRRVIQRLREKNLAGILNGVDYEALNPAADEHIDCFDPRDLNSVAYSKSLNKASVYREFGIEPNNRMLITMMCRLVNDKGIDLMLDAVPGINELDGIQVLIVGEPDNLVTRGRLEELKGNVRAFPNFQGPRMQHLIYAGSDAMLAPSRFEPCNLVLPEGNRYGTASIAPRLGGFIDTVVPFDGTSGYGIVIDSLTPRGIIEAIAAAREIYQSKPSWSKILTNALRADFAWDGERNPVGQYEQLYQQAIEKHNHSSG